VAQRSVARKVFQIAPLAQTQAERLRRLALATKAKKLSDIV
jgi:hypothetical protein